MNRDLVRFDRLVTIAIFILAAFVPFLLTTYEIKLATTVLIQAGLAASLGLVVGMAGLVSVGHAAFYGLAAYLVVIAAPQTGSADLLYTAAIAVLGATVFAGLVGAVSIRSRGLYFILMTLAFGQLGYHFFHDTGLVGSADGSYLNARPELRFGSVSLSLDKPGELYVLVWTVVCAVVLVCWCVRRSAFGQIVMAARDNEARVRAFGYSPYLLRLSLFVVRRHGWGDGVSDSDQGRVRHTRVFELAFVGRDIGDGSDRRQRHTVGPCRWCCVACTGRGNSATLY